jgi:DNA-binding GntR family transcriptional regulator
MYTEHMGTYTPSQTQPSVKQRDTAYQELRRLLILQQLPSGSRLRETQWAQRLGVNRMALREAFASLEAESLIQRGDKAGYWVPALTEDDIREIMEVRCCLECLAIERIVVSNGEGVLAPLLDTVKQLAYLIEGGFWLAITEADHRFHKTLIELSGNQRLVTIYQKAPLPMIHDRLIGTDRWPVQCQRILREHRAIHDAIHAGDAGQAKAILTEHLDEKYLIPIPV